MTFTPTPPPTGANRDSPGANWDCTGANWDWDSPGADWDSTVMGLAWTVLELTQHMSQLGPVLISQKNIFDLAYTKQERTSNNCK